MADSGQEEWGLLDPAQKELYWDAMLEKYGSAVSQGLPPPLPDARAELEPGLEPGSPSAGAEGPGSLRSGGERPDPAESPASGLPAPEPVAARRQPYTCEQCGRGFDWKSVFVIHHRTHRAGPSAPRPPRRAPPAARNYTCAECGRGFSWKSQLVMHRRGHAARPRHVCGDCGRGFDWKSQLVIHRRGHRPGDP